MVLSQNVKIWFINVRENSFRRECQLPINSWSKFPIVGSSVSSKPLQVNKFTFDELVKSLCETYLADFLPIGSV